MPWKGFFTVADMNLDTQDHWHG